MWLFSAAPGLETQPSRKHYCIERTTSRQPSRESRQKKKEPRTTPTPRPSKAQKRAPSPFLVISSQQPFDSHYEHTLPLTVERERWKEGAKWNPRKGGSSSLTDDRTHPSVRGNVQSKASLPVSTSSPMRQQRPRYRRTQTSSVFRSIDLGRSRASFFSVARAARGQSGDAN